MTSGTSTSSAIGRRIHLMPRWLWVVFAFVVLLVAARLALPYALKRYINHAINSIPGYYGGVENVHVALWRGAYRIDDIEILKTHGSEKEPFFSTSSAEISVDWHALLNRRVVTKISLIRPKLQFIERASKAASQTSMDASWQDQVKKLIPFRINRFIIANGLVRYKDETSKPKINLFFDQLDLAAENIDNAAHTDERLPSNIDVSARLLKSGVSKLHARMNFLSKPMEADMKASIRDLDLKEINDFAKAYGNFDFEKGKFNLTLELAATKARYEGYAKTLLKDVDILDWSKERAEGDSVGHLLWEGMVGAIMDIFKNHGKDQFAARIPITGSRKEMAIDKWATVGSILRNTFVQALSPKFEDSVDFGKVAKKPAPPASDKSGSASGSTSSGSTSGSASKADNKRPSPEAATAGAPGKVHH